jgi:FkbH-like protein
MECCDARGCGDCGFDEEAEALIIFKLGIIKIDLFLFMYQLEWGKKSSSLDKYLCDYQFDQHLKTNNKNNAREMLVCWEEHCLECAPPLCYQTCEKYEARPDKKCRNFSTGIKLVKELSTKGSSPVFIQFKEWSKLETFVTNSFFSNEIINVVNKLNNVIIDFISIINVVLPKSINKKKRINGLFYYLRDLFLKKLKSEKKSISILRIDVYLLNHESVKFKVECEGYSGGFNLSKGFNKVEMPLLLNAGVSLRIFPENNIQADLLITTLKISLIEEKKPLAKQIVKCVVWDLDNTLWSGVLTEGNVEIRKDILQTVCDLDSKGILNSVCSKNNFDDAIAKLTEFGIQDYFLFPEINWNPKSDNVRKIAEKLNIGLDSILFVDDSSFEREEVKYAIPELIVVNETFFPDALNTDLFDLPITETSRNRRKLYLMEYVRESSRNEFGDNYLNFLKNSELILTLKKPTSSDELTRSKELLQRTNQLNLSTRRFTDEEFNGLIEDNDLVKLIFSVSDKFGDYGIVGFMSFYISDNILYIEDLVISCRVVQKMVENTLLKAVFELNDNGNELVSIQAKYKETARNSPILTSFLNMGFRKINEGLIIDAKLLDVSELPVRYNYL